MKWHVLYTAAAKQDLHSLYRYIAAKLCEPGTAASQAQRIMREIRSLSAMPMRYRLYEDEPWHSQGLRFFSVGNYLVFYLPREDARTVYIVRIMYGGRDIRKQLEEAAVDEEIRSISGCLIGKNREAYEELAK